MGLWDRANALRSVITETENILSDDGIKTSAKGVTLADHVFVDHL
jgi:hypothetical protein